MEKNINTPVDPEKVTETPSENSEEGIKTYTEAEKDALITKAVENALLKRDKKHQADQAEAIKQAVAEALEREKMSEEDRLDADLKDRLADIERREAEFAQKEFKVSVMGALQEHQLPLSLTDMIVASATEDTLSEVIQGLRKDWDDAIKEKVKAGARQPDPKVSDPISSSADTDVQSKLAKIANENRKGVK